MQSIVGRIGSSNELLEHPDAEPCGRDLPARAATVASVAAAAADAVDGEARFPREAIEAMRGERLLGIMLPGELGGEDAGLGDIADVCYRIGQSCSSTAMIYAMHQASLACVLRHHQGSPWHRGLLRDVATQQLLLASSTTEGQAGGNVRASAAPIERDGTAIHLDRAATVVSYGAEADAIVTTARRSATAAPSDQVLVAFRREDYRLEQTGGWDSLGMRGTRSLGFSLKARGQEDQILPEPYESIHPRSMVPVSHLLWAATWAGIAAGAVERARAFARRAARQSNGALPPGAPHVTRALASLHTLRGSIAAAVETYERVADDAQALTSIDVQMMMTLTKVEASEAAVAIVLEAGRATGLAGYRNDSEFSIGRSLRDVLSAPIMINNDRILANLATTTLLTPVPGTLRG